MKKIITVFIILTAFLLGGSSAMAMPGSGSAVIAPSSDVVAGALGKWTVTYTASENFLTGTVHLIIPAGWTPPQISNGSAAGYVTAASEGVLGAVPVTIDGMSVRVNVDTLLAGQTVDIVYGDDSVSSSGNAAAQTTAQAGVQFTVRSNPVGNSPADIAVSPALNVIASEIAQLIFVTAPAGFTAGSESSVMRVATRDQYGNKQVVAANQAVDLSSESGTGSFSALPGPGWSAVTSVTIAAGEDTATFYYRDTTAGAHDITASASAQSWSDAVQQATVTAGEPARLAVSPQDSTIVAGDFARFLVEVTDIYGNRAVLPVDQTISLLSTSGNSFYDTDDHGVNITSLVIPSGASSGEVDFMHTAMNLATGYLAAFLDMDGIPPSLESTATTIYIDHSAADAASSRIDVDKYLVTADGVDEVTVSVTSMDEYDNPVSGTAVLLQATDTGGGNQITQPSGATGPDGIAVGTVRSTVAETKTISATIDGAEIVDNEEVVFIAGPVSLTLSEISVDADTVTADGTDQATITVVARDAYGNTVPGRAVTLEMSGSGNSITQPVGVTGANGIATGTVRSTVAEAKTVRARIDGSYMTDDVDLVFIAGAASLTLSEISADKGTITADGTDEAVVTVVVRDAQGNTISGSLVALEMSGSGNSITQPVGVTGADGIATGTMRSTVAETKTARARIDGAYMAEDVDLAYVAGPVSLVVSGITSDTDTVTADGTDQATITVVVRDAQGNTVPDRAVTLEMSGSGNSITQPVGVTGADGIATGTVRSTVAESKTVRAQIDGSYMTDDVDLVFIAGAASLSLSEISSDKGTVTADGTDQATITVVVRDAQGNTVPGRTVTLEMSGSGNSITQPVGVTGANGVATGTVRSTVAEAKTVRALIDGSYMADDVDLVFNAGNIAYFLISHDGSGVAGISENINVEVYDINDNKVNLFEGIIKVYTDSAEEVDLITWGIGDGTGTIMGESADTLRYQFAPSDGGDVTLNITDNRAEAIRIYASIGGVVSTSVSQLVVGHGTADRIFVTSGDMQRAVVNTAVPSPLVAGVEDQWGNRVAGQTVTFSVTAGGGSIDTDSSTGGIQTTDITNAQGLASCDTWILGTVSGYLSDRVRAAIPSGSVVSADFRATTDHDDLDTVVLSPASSSVTVNSSTIITATMRDRFANLVTAENLTVFIKDTPDGTLGPDGSNPNPTISLGPAIRSGTSDSTGTITLVYNAPGSAGIQDVIDANHPLISAESIADVTYTSVASGATKLLAADFSSANTQAGITFSFIVKAVDSNNNLDPSNTSHITITPEAGSGLTFSLTDFGASVTEADLSGGFVTLYCRGTKAGTWNVDLGASAPVLAPASFETQISANNTVHHYVFETPVTAVAGSDFQMRLQAKDVYGNLVTTANYDIGIRAVQAVDTTAASSDVISVTSGTISGGVYSESNFSYNRAEEIRLEVSDMVSPVVGVTDLILITHAPAYQIVETGGDSTGVAAGDSVLVRACVYDIYGNRVSGAGVSFSILEGGGGLAASQRFTRADGTTSVSYRTGTAAGLNRVRAAILDGNPQGLETQTYEIYTVPSNVISYVLLSIEGNSFRAGENFQCHAAAYDQFDNLMTTDNSSRLVPVAQSPSIAFIPDTLTLSAGEASFTAYDTVMGVNRIAIESETGSVLAPFGELLTITAAPAYILAKVSGDTTGVISGDTTEVMARVKDYYGNPVAGEIVRFGIKSDLGGSPSLLDDIGAPGDGIVTTNALGYAWCRLVTDTNTGTNIVEATILDGEPAERERVEFSVETSAGSISRYELATDNYTRKAGEHFDVDIVAYDLNGNVAYGDFTTVVQLGSNATAVWDSNPVTLSNGSVTVGVVETLAGNLVLSAETFGGGAMSYSGTVTVKPEAPFGIIGISSVVPDTITADGDSRCAITTGQILDQYGNIVETRSKITVEPSDGTVASDDTDPAISGVQRETAINGVVSAFIESSAMPGNVTVEFTSVEGTAAGTASIYFAPPPACEYDGFISPHFVVPGTGAAFEFRVANSSATGLYIGTASRISFNDGAGHTYSAALAAPVFLGSSGSAVLVFQEQTVPAQFLGGTYTPEVRITGIDVHGAAYNATINAGTNSVTVTNVEITRVTALKSVVSRGETTEVGVSVRNGGGSPIRLENINLSFARGDYSVSAGTVPSLPDTILPGLEKTYALSVTVLPYCATGMDTIDASVHATANGSDVYDYSAGANKAAWLVQSAASISYINGSLSPSVVSAGQDQAFSVGMLNSGQAPVILEVTETYLTFTDGAETFISRLGEQAALPGNANSTISFPAANVPASMAYGRHGVTVRLHGTENGAPFDTSMALADSADVVAPADLQYVASSLMPSIVSKNSSVSFSVDLMNNGGATVFITPGSSFITFTDGVNVYTAYVDGERSDRALPGLNTIWFRSVVVRDAFATGDYTPSVHIAGMENGIAFAADPAVTDGVSVQEPSQLAINSIDIIPSNRMTADQSQARLGLVRVENNGEAMVRLDSLSVRLFIGGDPVSDEFVITPVSFEPGAEYLSGGQLDSFMLMMADEPSNAMTTGVVTVEATVWGTDLNSSAILIATTEYGGKGSLLVQSPADPVVTLIAASVQRATVSQTNDWTVEVALENRGESDLDIDLNPSATYLTFSTSGDFSVIYPAGLEGGGTVLEGKSTDKLIFTIDRTGSVPGPCAVNIAAACEEINSGRILPTLAAPAGTAAEVLVEEAAVLAITGLTPLQNPVTINQSREWQIDMVVTNTGGSALMLDLADHDSTGVDIPGGSGFIFEYPGQLLGGGISLDPGQSGTLRFTVSATGTAPPGVNAITGRVKGTEINSGNTVFAQIDEAASTFGVEFDLLPAPVYVSSSLRPLSASSGTEIVPELEISSGDPEHSTLELDPAKTFLWFGDADGDTLRTYLSESSADLLAGGSSAALIFDRVLVDTGIARQSYTVGLHLEGVENGNPFEIGIDSAPDAITIEEAPQLSIISIGVPASVTRSSQPPWEARMILHNSGEASVQVDVDPADTWISFTIAGIGDRTSEYSMIWPDRLQQSGDLVLAGGRTDTLVFTVLTTGSTAGTAIINGKVTATDINSSETLTDDTYTGGGSYMLVQNPAVPVVISSLASRDLVTSGQSTPWTVTLLVQNQGGAAMTLAADSTYIFADYPLAVPSPPSAFLEGGGSLAAGESKHLVFNIGQTPVIEAGYDLGIDARTGFFEDNSGAFLGYDTGESGTGGTSVRVQARADLRIERLAGVLPNLPRANRGQRFPIVVEITNSGEATAGQVNIQLAGDGSSTVENSPLTVVSVPGFQSVTDTFHVTAADIEGMETFAAGIVSAVDENSGQDGLVVLSPAADALESILIENPAGLEIVSVLPSQGGVNAGQTVDWTLKVELRNGGGAPATVAQPAAGDISFRLGASRLADYLILPPAGFASGAADFTLESGESDSLVYVISSTGIDTGLVDIDATSIWSDGNDPAAGNYAASGTAQIHVKEPSGLRIISVTSDAPNNVKFPNTSIVNIMQSFRINVRVENTGGDDLEQIEVSLTSNGPAAISTINETNELPSGSSGDFTFEVSSSEVGVEILTASIQRAVSVNTGQEVPPIQAVESTENLQVQIAAVLSCDMSIASPQGAVDDTVSAGQTFELTAIVSNLGEASDDGSGQLTLELPSGYGRAYPDADSLVRSFSTGDQVTWTIIAPSEPSTLPALLKASISRAPRDVNIGTTAFVQKAADEINVVTEEKAGTQSCGLLLASPSGATDGILSTEQEFVVSGRFTPSANSSLTWAELSVPAGFAISGDARRQTGDGGGVEIEVDWTVTGPASPVSDVQAVMSTGGTDLNSGLQFSGCSGNTELSVVEKASLALEAFISGPEQALDGNLSVNLPFTIEALVSNEGAAGIDTTGARLEIVLPADAEYAIDNGGTYKKPFYPGVPVVWNLRAPATITPPRIINVRFAEPAALDENSRMPAEVIAREVPIGVSTEAGSISLLNISSMDTIPPYVVPQGAGDVPVLRIVFKNKSAFTAGLDTIYVSVQDERGINHGDPSRYVDSIELMRGAAVIGSSSVGGVNPVPLYVLHAFTIDPSQEDTLLVRIDLAEGAPEGKLGIALARSADVVFSIGEERSPVGVMWDGDGGDIAGHFNTGPLSVMSSDFESYVHNYPNPFRAGSESTRITYYLTENTNVSINIYDMLGILVWRKEMKSGQAGAAGDAGGTLWEIEWDGRNGRGEVVRNGVYMCKLQAGSRSVLFKIAVAK